VGEQATGAGLGLAISKEIVGLHGGALDIRSPPPGFDKGTVVFISLPLARPPAVLVVEDDEGVRGLLAEQIAQEGYTVLLAPSGSAAEAMLAAQRPEVIVLDLVLPDADGTEFILKARTEAGAVPPALIVVTGAAISSSRREILDSFSIPTLGKPWDAVELMEALADVFIGRGVLGRRSA
jgi:CheY-like chemotaxis protein